MALAGASVGLGAPSMGRAWASLRKPRWGFQTARHSTAAATEPAGNLEDFRTWRAYLDAVFYSRAASDETVLQQEGWHYEVDGDSKLTYSGVVYNEMKGVYSSPDSLMQRAAQQALFPDNAYGVDSGGDPNAIPDLDFAQFQAFHGEFYHPTNSRIFFYGDDDPLERLELLDEYLSDFVERKGDTEVATQKITFAEPKKIVESADGQWPRRSRSSAGLSDELKQPTFAVGLKGVEAENVEKVEALVDTLKAIEAEGFDPAALAAPMNTIEFARAGKG
ncbi:metallopeptidase [Aureococcus anophagefferens]|nr:metallopeptidase [Aureococcus anophagefferens]